jgi:hypothetical protein
MVQLAYETLWDTRQFDDKYLCQIMARKHLFGARVAARATQPGWLHLRLEGIIAAEGNRLILHVRCLWQWQATQIAN